MAVPNSLQKIVYFLLMVQFDGLVGWGRAQGPAPHSHSGAQAPSSCGSITF